MRTIINPAEFDRRISIMRYIKGEDEAGMPTLESSPQKICDAWTKYIPVSDGEKLTHKPVSELTARFTIRWTPKAASIETSDRLVFEGHPYGIFGIKEVGRRQYLEITAKEIMQRPYSKAAGVENGV